MPPSHSLAGGYSIRKPKHLLEQTTYIRTINMDEMRPYKYSLQGHSTSKTACFWRLLYKVSRTHARQIHPKKSHFYRYTLPSSTSNHSAEEGNHAPHTNHNACARVPTIPSMHSNSNRKKGTYTNTQQPARPAHEPCTRTAHLLEESFILKYLKVLLECSTILTWKQT